jgi:hypothetical protein
MRKGSFIAAVYQSQAHLRTGLAHDSDGSLGKTGLQAVHRYQSCAHLRAGLVGEREKPSGHGVPASAGYAYGLPKRAPSFRTLAIARPAG